MRIEVDTVLAANQGVGTRTELLAFLTRAQLDDEIRRGYLVNVAPRVYARPWQADGTDVQELAVLKQLGDSAALSHVSALARWGLMSRAPGAAIHATVKHRHRPRPGRAVAAPAPSSASRAVLVVHRTRFPVRATRVGNVLTVEPARAIVSSWSMRSGSEQRAPAISAVQKRLVSADQLSTVLAGTGRVRGRAELSSLIALLAAGCHSELELWGYRSVFEVPELGGAIRQRTLVIAGRSYVLDMAYERERVAVELDGRAYHASTAQWERDIRRDVALATAGWQTLRLSHRRLTTDVAGCRRDVLAVLTSRRSCAY